jgi:solute carrier family 8 (sodium/calcium exchanger)
MIYFQEADGETKEIKIKVWNETVSNLTLMALGSSAPEILLSVIETFGNGMKAGDLGPSTIVGSAAFNLFMIIAICIYVIPDGESRKIKHLRVFFITALWSILAYVWLYVIVVASSPGVVEPWEATITLIFFPLLTIWAWIADKRLLVYDFVYKKYQKKGKIIKEYEGVEMNVSSNSFFLHFTPFLPDIHFWPGKNLRFRPRIDFVRNNFVQKVM